MKTLETLRAKHPRLIYQAFDYEVEGDALSIRFHFTLEPDVAFMPTIRIPLDTTTKKAVSMDDVVVFESLIFHLGMIELISYWKAACSATIVVKAGMLDEEQLTWWKELYLLGLGEFFYLNEIDFQQEDFLTLKCESTFRPQTIRRETSGCLVLASGGKDSAVTLELLKNLDAERKVAFMLNPTRSAKDSLQISGYNESISALRTIDPKLLELNANGYLNGHTPFSAYLAFLSTLVAAIHGFRHIVVSNEASASEANTYIGDHPINHQYSKSLDFERRFREYQKTWLCPDTEYFSFLRPLSDEQVTNLFAQLDTHFTSFRSCNVGQKDDRWCGSCPKCASVYLSLFPRIGLENSVSIFGEDLFYKEEIISELKKLLGLEDTKPFECVGSMEEARDSLRASIAHYRDSGRSAPSVLSELEVALPDEVEKEQVDGEHFLPPEFESILIASLSANQKRTPDA